MTSAETGCWNRRYHSERMNFGTIAGHIRRIYYALHVVEVGVQLQLIRRLRMLLPFGGVIDGRRAWAKGNEREER